MNGTAATFYLGRYPWLNAMADRTRNTRIATRQHMYGGTLGNPIIKNKLFSFFSFENWKVGNPQTYARTVPTPLERQGDFSRSLSINGAPRIIYDPWSTTFNPATNTYSRTPFPGNRHTHEPLRSRCRLIAPLVLGSEQSWRQYHRREQLPCRILPDVQLLQLLRARRLQHQRQLESLRPHWTLPHRRPAGRPDSEQLATVRSDRHAERGDSDLRRCGVDGDSNNGRQLPRRLAQGHRRVCIGTACRKADGRTYGRATTGTRASRTRLPACRCTSRTSTSAAAHIGGGGFYWNQAPKGESINAKISQQRGSHYLKAGLEYRRSYGLSFVSNTSRFNFPASLTANTPVNPNTLDTGSAVASFLLGAMNPDATQMIGGPAPDPHIKYWGMFIQDDWKVSRNITLNLGLRNEYETGFYDPQRFFGRGLDLSAPVPEMQANPPQMPAQALALVGANYFKWNGLYQWTGDGNPSGMWDSQKFTLQPRAGIAIRITDRTAFRAGYARYVTPMELGVITPPISGFETVGFLSPPYFGVTGFQNPAPLIREFRRRASPIHSPRTATRCCRSTAKPPAPNVGRGQTSGMFWYPTNLKTAVERSPQLQLPAPVPGPDSWVRSPTS